MRAPAALLLSLVLAACNQTDTSQSVASTSSGAQPAAPVSAAQASRPAAPTSSAAVDPDLQEDVNPGYNQKDTPPDFKLKYLANGKGELSLRSLVGPDNKGKVDGVVVAFTASWCGRCKASYPTLEALQKQHGDRLKILLLTAEEDEAGKEKMAAIVREEKLTLPLLDAPPDLIEAWLGTKRNIPRFYLIDHKGMVRVKDTGFGNKMAKLLPEHVAWLLARRDADQQAAKPL